jgi:hypothetical protein
LLYLSSLATCLCSALTHEEQKRIRFAYQYSVFQLELSRNLLFLRGTTMNEVYQKLIDRTRAPLDLKQVKTISGFSHRPHKIATRGHQVVKAVEAQSYDLTRCGLIATVFGVGIIARLSDQPTFCTVSSAMQNGLKGSRRSRSRRHSNCCDVGHSSCAQMR